jgi:hypothetical protein
MALEVTEDQDCPRCPPSQVHEHDAVHGGMNDDADSELPCADSVSDCAIVDDLNLDARNKLSKDKDASAFVVIAASSPNSEFALPKDRARWSDTANLHFPSGPPLNIRHCVFLK